MVSARVRREQVAFVQTRGLSRRRALRAPSAGRRRHSASIEDTRAAVTVIVAGLVVITVLGGIAMEESSEGNTRRNDRLLAVPLLLHQDRPPHELSDMPSAELEDIEDFLVAYQAADGKVAKIVGRLDKSEAESIVKEAAQA